MEEETRSFEILLEEYESSERGTWQNPDLVLGKLGDLRGKIVADIGSGTGYFTFPLAKTAARVIAIDIEPAYLEYIEESKLDLSPEISSVIETRLTAADDPNLSVDEADAILMVNVYYYLDDRPAYMARVHRGLRDGGVLVLVDFKVGEMPVGPAEDKVPSEQAVRDLKEAGFQVLEVDLESLQYQYIITAK
jgi:SAM-dependent methyltransferase